jgi:MFS family permease
MTKVSESMIQPNRSQNLRTLALRSFLFGLQSNMVRALWQPFVLNLGASVPMLGLLESIGGYGGIVSTAMLPIGGWLSDRRGRKPFVVVSSGLSLASLVIFALAGVLRDWRLLLPGVILLGLSAIARPAIDSMVAESATFETRGQAFSLTNVAFSLSGIVAPTIGGWLASRYGFILTLLIGALLEAGVLSLVSLRLAETRLPGRRTALSSVEFSAVVRKILTPPAKLRSFYIAVTIDLFAFGMGLGILFGLLSKEYHFAPLQLGLMSSINSLVCALLQMSVGKQVDKRGCVPFLVFSEAVAVLVVLGWLLARSFVAFLALHALLGVSVATWVPAYMSWIANSIPEGKRAEEMGRLGAFRGLLSFPAAYVGGLLYNAMGFRGPILGNLLGAILVTILFWRTVSEPQAPSPT